MARLLDAAGCGEKNIRALTSVMDLERVTVRCDHLLEIDAWRKIAVESNVIKTLYFNWDTKGGFQYILHIIIFIYLVGSVNKERTLILCIELRH